MTNPLIRDRSGEDTRRRRDKVSTQADPGVRQPGGKSLEAGRSKEGFSPRASRGSAALLPP